MAPDRSFWDFLFMQFVWPLVDYPGLDLGFDSPHAGERHYGGSILMMLVGLTVPLIAQKLLIAMMTSTFQEMKRDAELRFKLHRVSRVVRYASSPREPMYLFLLEFIACSNGMDSPVLMSRRHPESMPVVRYLLSITSARLPLAERPTA